MSELLNIEVEIGSVKYKYIPKRDITAYEVAQMNVFIAVVVAVMTTSEQKEAFLTAYGLWRHFEKKEE